MKYTKIIASVVMGSMLLAQGAFAQGFPGGHGGPDNQNGPQGPQGHQGGGRQQEGWNNGPQGGGRGPHGGWQGGDGPRHDNGNHYGQGRPDNTRYVIIEDHRGIGPRHDIRRGGYLPHDYRHHQFYVDDWRDHDLYAPPRGYRWVQVGGDYVLAAITTGLIMQILLNR